MVLWRIILLLISIVTIPVHSQLDSLGFLSIDCGISPNITYVDTMTRYTYVSDEQFIDTGVNIQIPPSNGLSRAFETVRSFPTGIRNCYTLRSLTIGSKYLIRATFNYANYDKLNKPPIFDIYLGVNFWDTVNASSPFYPEIIVNATADYLHVCLVNKNLGNPFISSLHLRPQKSTVYQEVQATQSLIWVRRAYLGIRRTIFIPFIRYPDDKYDRWWFPETLTGTTEISTNSNSTVQTDDDFQIPSSMKRTAATTSTIQQPLNLSWTTNDISTKFYFILHFYEIQTSLTGPREFDILINGNKQFSIPTILQTWNSSAILLSSFNNYNVSLVATSNSILPPLLNGYELYRIAPVGVPTYGADVAAINGIKQDHHIKKGWSGDPCLPKVFIWTGVSCTSNSSNITRITALNLSSSGLTGPLSLYLGNLSALVSLDLSSNKLSGSLPSSLDQLTALTYLDIRGNNNILTTLPLGLQQKQQNGTLTYRFDINANPSPPPFSTAPPFSPASPSLKNYIIIIISIAVAVPLSVIAIVVATIFLLRRKQNQPIVPNQDDSSESGSVTNIRQDFPVIDNLQFSYNDLKRITNDFQNIIGIGGFGSVYLGVQENGLQVAVKMRSHSSSQGVKEFMAEARNLGRVHHKSLVALKGYCIGRNCLALVYEYMEEGNLQEKLKDDVRPLTWKQRLKIAYQSAQGLEYLHKACNPPLIHRDVKASNILLNANLEAKIADFGLCKAFDSDAVRYVSTRIIGTPGYLDPEYYSSSQLSAKSDVYSFGVVLLEIITGQPPISEDLEGGNLVQWVRRNLSVGDIKSIVDPKMQNKYDINSVWKVTNVACRCTESSSSERPSMSAVVSELKESLELEISTDIMYCECSTDNLATDVSQGSAFDMAYMGGMQVPGLTVR